MLNLYNIVIISTDLIVNSLNVKLILYNYRFGMRSVCGYIDQTEV